MRRLVVVFDHPSLLSLEIDHTFARTSMLPDVVGNLLRMRLGGILALRRWGKVGMSQYRHDGCGKSFGRVGVSAQESLTKCLAENQ